MQPTISEIVRSDGAWGILGCAGRDPDAIAREAGRLLDDRPRLKRRLEWWRQRFRGQAGDGEGPRGVPVLATGAANGEMGWIGWLSASVVQSAEPDARHPDQPTADLVARWCAARAKELGWPWPPGSCIRFDARDSSDSIWGESCGLSTLLAAALAALELEYPPTATLACTGTLRDGEAPRLAPVCPETLPAKALVARCWGYRTLAVVRGQDGIDAIRRAGLAVLEVDPQPGIAIHQLIDALGCTVVEDTAVQLLLLVDRALSASRMPQHEAFQAVLDSRCTDERPLVRALACNMQARRALHQGLSAEADTWTNRTLAALDQVEALPDGPLGRYFELQFHAHTAIVALDNGRWEAAHPLWPKLQRQVEAIIAAPKRPQAIDRLFGEICLLNAVARWHDTRGRWSGDAEALRASWRLRTHHHRHWRRCCDYAERLGDRSTSLERWHHECLDVLVAWHALRGRLPEQGELPGPHWSELGLWVAQDGWTWPSLLAEVQPQADREWSWLFRAVYALHWLGIAHREHLPPAQRLDDDIASRLLERLPPGRLGYPAFLIPECLLRWELVGEPVRRAAGQRLADSELFPAEPEPRHSILCLLALRAAALLDRAGIPHRPPLPPPDGTPLARLAGELRADPTSIIRRCPY